MKFNLAPKWWSILFWICIGIIVCGNTLTGEARPSIKRVIKQAAGDTLTFEVKGLVCSFCAHGLSKGIGKMDYTDEKGINQTIKVIEESGYEVHKITYKNKVIIVRKEE